MNESNNNRKPTMLQRMLWWCAGVDTEIIEICPHEWAKYASMGATILFTGVLAALAGGYALYTVFRSGEVDSQGSIPIDTTALCAAIAFGILWGMIIFNLDRYIITSFKKSDADSGFVRFRKDFLHALPRIVLAVIIAITISKPIEIKLFESRLTQQIEENKKAKMESNAADFNRIFGLDDIRAGIKQTETEKIKLVEELNTYPPYIQDMKNELTELTRKKQDADRNVATAQKEMNDLCIEDNYEHTWDSVTLSWKRTHLKPEPRRQYNAHLSKHNRYKNNSANLQKEILQKEAEIGKAKTEYRLSKQKEIASADSVMEVQKQSLADNSNSAKEGTTKANMVAEVAFRNNFVTQLEALSDLKDANIKDGDSEIVIAEKKKQARTFTLISLALTLLFLCIELAPILTKLIISRGAYDDLIDATDYELNNMARDSKLRTDAQIRISSGQYEAECKANIAANEALMSRISEVQAELMQTAIEEWRKEELEKIKANPSNYIKSNTQK